MTLVATSEVRLFSEDPDASVLVKPGRYEVERVANPVIGNILLRIKGTSTVVDEDWARSNGYGGSLGLSVKDN